MSGAGGRTCQLHHQQYQGVPTVNHSATVSSPHIVLNLSLHLYHSSNTTMAAVMPRVRTLSTLTRIAITSTTITSTATSGRSGICGAFFASSVSTPLVKANKVNKINENIKINVPTAPHLWFNSWGKNAYLWRC